jgi:signal transduction histidine kinase
MSALEKPDRPNKHSTVWWVAVIYSVAAVVMVGIAVATYRAASELQVTQEAVDHTHVVLGNIERAYSGIVGAASAVRDYVVANDDEALDGRTDELLRLNAAIEDLAVLTADNADQQRRIEVLKPLIAARVEWLSRTMLAYEMGGSDGAREALRNEEPTRLMTSIRAVLEAMRQAEEILLSERFAAQERSQARRALISLVLLIAVCVAILVGFFALIRDSRYKDGLRALVLERERRLAAANEDLRRNAEALTVSNKELEGFSYSISHDLRSPLRAIDGFAVMLEQDCGSALNADGRRYISVIRDNASRMSALIDDLLKFSRFGRYRLQAGEAETATIVNKARDEALAAHPEATTQFDIRPLPRSHGDMSLLHQVWVNLIGNAIKYSGRVANPHVEIGGDIVGKEARFFVRDNGAGFDMKFVDKLFGVFQRLHGPEEFPGTGVGLAIVQRIVARHGGRVWAEGEVGKGATFYFTLPFGSVREAPEVVVP